MYQIKASPEYTMIGDGYINRDGDIVRQHMRTAVCLSTNKGLITEFLEQKDETNKSVGSSGEPPHDTNTKE